MIALQLIGMAIALVALYMSFLYYKRKDFNRLEFLFWLIIWLGFMTVVITPSSFNFILKTLVLWRMLDLIVIIALVVIYMLTFSNYVKNKEIQKKIEALISENALKPIKDGLEVEKDISTDRK